MSGGVPVSAYLRFLFGEAVDVAALCPMRVVQGSDI